MSVTEAEDLLRPDAAAALAAWAALVDAARAQEARLSEVADLDDRWETVADRFRPGDIDAPEVAALGRFTQPGDTWVDIGAGGGRFTVPLARRVTRVVAVEPSAAMRESLYRALEEQGTPNVEVADGRWPAAAAHPAVPAADGFLAANVLYEERDLAAFVAAMEHRSRRWCVAVLGDRGRGETWPVLWEGLYGEPACVLPGMREFVAVLLALDRRVEVATVALGGARPRPLDDAMRQVRRLLWVREGSERDRRLAALVREHFGGPDGLVTLPPRRRYNGIVAWRPPRTAGATGEPLPAPPVA